jgi:RNAse (barnase) inhibitor barstar
MTGLAALLAGQVEPGVYRWPGGTPVDEAADLVRQSGRGFAVLDGATAATKGEVLAALGEALMFPDHYGANFDALADCLADLTEPTVLLWDCWGGLADTDQRSFSILLTILGDTDQLIVLLHGDGPAVPVAELA